MRRKRRAKHGFKLGRWTSGTPTERLGKKRWVQVVSELSQYFTRE